MKLLVKECYAAQEEDISLNCSIMNSHAKVSPVPSDYFGILWALAGVKDIMILEHGPTGNARYNLMNFRAMDRQSPRKKLFSTGLKEDELILGSDEKIATAVKEIDTLYSPDVIALVATCVSKVVGVDLEGIAAELQPDVNARLLVFGGGGFVGNYTDGIRDVFTTLVREFATEKTSMDEMYANIIGPSIDTFNSASDNSEIERLLCLLGIRVNTILSASTDIESIKSLPNAAVNIVTNESGLEAARLLEERFGTPYIYGLPFGVRGTTEWLKDLACKLDMKLDKDIIIRELKKYGYTFPELTSVKLMKKDLDVAVCCPYDLALGLTRYIVQEWNYNVKIVVLPVKPETTEYINNFSELGVSKVLVEPDLKSFMHAMEMTRPHLLFGNIDHIALMPEVPIKIQAASPTYDKIFLYDGTPFVGYRGNAFLLQNLINSLVDLQEDI
ncbi:nitrogenase component 1 [uncultured Methanolobus sp.]|uniref:nitrogenase component 1 n=1 Tax=uncultured Methanolobus sp. TaxID=218300 RepID=UPI0029C65B62|nr:nitrogenase component 1 [uncultured Methanolobus sp.]